MADQTNLISKLRQHFVKNNLAVEESSDNEVIEQMPKLRRMTQMFKAKEVRDLVKSTYSSVDLLVGGTFSGMPVVGIFTVADGLGEEKIQEIFKEDVLKTQKLWSDIQNKNYFTNWKDWALYYDNVVSALSGIFCLRYFLFSSSEEYQKFKPIIQKMKSRTTYPMIGIYGFACNVAQGEVVSPKFTFWFGAGAFHPTKIAKVLAS